MPKTSWTKLATNAYPSDDVIYTEAGEGWAVGDKIIISSSSFDRHEMEEREIAAVETVDSSDAEFTQAQTRDAFGMSYGHDDAVSTSDYIAHTGLVTKVTLNEPLEYYHAGVKLSDEFG